MKVCELFEELINYNHHTQSWQIRNDGTLRFMDEVPSVVIANARPYVDYDGQEQGKRVYAYIQGNIVPMPNLEGLQPFPVKFQPNTTTDPFINAATGETLDHADYIVFNGRSVTGYNK